MKFEAPKRKIVKIISAITIFLWSSPSFAFAAYKLLQKLPTSEGLKGEMNLSDYFTWLFHFALVAAAFLAVLKIVIGGLQIIMGGASETARTKGKEMIEMALWGLLLAVSSVLILTAINPDLVKKGFVIPDITVKGIKSNETSTEYVPNEQGGGFCSDTKPCPDGYACYGAMEGSGQDTSIVYRCGVKKTKDGKLICPGTSSHSSDTIECDSKTQKCAVRPDSFEPYCKPK